MTSPHAVGGTFPFIGRYAKSPSYTNRYGAGKPAGQLTLHKLMNEGAEQGCTPAVTGDNRVGISIIELPPGQETGYFSRSTEEAVFVLQGSASLRWAAGERHVQLEKWDTASPPVALSHSWSNSGAAVAYLLMIYVGRNEIASKGLIGPQSASTNSDDPTVETMERDYIARWANVPTSEKTFPSSGVPGFLKTIHKIIGSGLQYQKDFFPALKTPHSFSLVVIEIPPGQGAGLHAHSTEEIFIPLDYGYKLFWSIGEGPQQTTDIGKWDIANMPIGCWRGFVNDREQVTHVLAVVAGTNEEVRGSIAYHPEVVEAIEKAHGPMDYVPRTSAA